MHFVLRLHFTEIMRFLPLPYIRSAFRHQVMNYGEGKKAGRSLAERYSNHFSPGTGKGTVKVA